MPPRKSLLVLVFVEHVLLFRKIVVYPDLVGGLIAWSPEGK
jgi:hypothetical protein